MIRQIESQSRQTLFDIALQHCGSADAVLDIASMNGMMPTTNPSPGDILLVPDMTNKKTVRYYEEHGIVPATA